MRKSSFKLFGFIFFIFGSIINFNAQNKSSEKDVEQEKKVTYLKDKLKLTDSENKTFFLELLSCLKSFANRYSFLFLNLLFLLVFVGPGRVAHT